MGMVDRTYTPKAGEGGGASDCLGPAHRSKGSDILMVTSPTTDQAKTMPPGQIADLGE